MFVSAGVHLYHLEILKTRLDKHNAFEIHSSIIDPKRPLRKFLEFHTCLICLMYVFTNTTLFVILHGRTYVSIASITTCP